MYFAVGNISNFDKHDLENHLSREGGGGGGEGNWHIYLLYFQAGQRNLTGPFAAEQKHFP